MLEVVLRIRWSDLERRNLSKTCWRTSRFLVLARRSWVSASKNSNRVQPLDLFKILNLMSSLHLIAPTCKLLPSTNQEHGNKAIYTVADTLERKLRFLDGDVHSSSRVRLRFLSCALTSPVAPVSFWGGNLVDIGIWGGYIYVSLECLDEAMRKEATTPLM